MTNIYRCEIELHDNLYYATREIGRLYETEAILHNYSLCYALGFVDSKNIKQLLMRKIHILIFVRNKFPSINNI